MQTQSDKVLTLQRFHALYQLDRPTKSGKAVVEWYEKRGPRPDDGIALLTMLAHALDTIDALEG